MTSKTAYLTPNRDAWRIAHVDTRPLILTASVTAYGCLFTIFTESISTPQAPRPKKLQHNKRTMAQPNKRVIVQANKRVLGRYYGEPIWKLAESFEVILQLQERGLVAIRSSDLTRTHRERLMQNGFLQEVIKGWYIPSRSDGAAGESTAWYASFWMFCAAYLEDIKGENWSLSPEQSLSLHAGNWAVSKQLLVRVSKARNNISALPHETALLDIRSSLPQGSDVEVKNGLRLYSLASSLIACAHRLYGGHTTVQI